jgi:peptidoglycan/xylan/chitin deacetylase (PgdA/CDA1 family)
MIRDLQLAEIAMPLLIGAAASAYYATYAVRSQWLGPTDWHGRTDTSSVALTFDDGPSADTKLVLNVLRQYEVPATFFMLGRQVERHPNIARRVAAEGHEIGNHSHSHRIYLYSGARVVQREMQDAQEAIIKTTGVAPRFSRPPCGVRTLVYFSVARQMNLRTVQWTVAGMDWKNLRAGQITREVLKNVRAGSIILLHDGDSARRRDRMETVLALPLIIERLRRRGLNIVPLSELVGCKLKAGRT